MGLFVIIDLHPDFAFTVEDRGEVMLGTVGREFAVAKCFEQLGLDECHMGFRRRSESFEAIAREQDARAAIEAKACIVVQARDRRGRSEEHTSELQSLMRISYAVFCLKKKKNKQTSKK